MGTNYPILMNQMETNKCLCVRLPMFNYDFYAPEIWTKYEHYVRIGSQSIILSLGMKISHQALGTLNCIIIKLHNKCQKNIFNVKWPKISIELGCHQWF